MNFENLFFETSEFNFSSSESLDSGTFGNVYIVTKKSDGKKYAAKIIKSDTLNDGQGQKFFIREVMILNQLDHPAIVKFSGINLHSFDSSNKLEPTILTEYYPNGSLEKILEKERNGSKEKILENWNLTKKYIFLLGISDAMRYLHQHNVIHRDLKPANILIDSNFYPKICDFGQSTIYKELFSESVKLSISGNIGTPLYNAPELLDDGIYNQSIDVYSFAYIAYEIVTKKKPFDDVKNAIKLSSMIIDGERPKFDNNVPIKIKNLITQCWNQNSSNRPSFDQIFDLLSNDFSFLGDEEKLDKNEIKKYISFLKNERLYQYDKENIHALKDKRKNLLSDNKEKNYCEIIKALISNSCDINDVVVSEISLIILDL